MEKPTYKLVGSPCAQQGQYTFYKALRFSGRVNKIVAIGDFFFVRIWQDSELVSIGELQLLWTDRVSDQTLVSLRLYFLPENTPDGRHLHGEDEVLAINDKVVLKAEDLLSWVCTGETWTWGLRAVWRGACSTDVKTTAPLHCSKLDFSDIDKEKSCLEEDVESPGVIVFSYPRYCRYRALLRRLDGEAAWLRDSLVAALGGYAAPTKNTRILYCKDTFEYPELEGHEFVCNHLAPRLKGRPRGRRRRRHSHSSDRNSDSDSEEISAPQTPQHSTPRRLSLRNGTDRRNSSDDTYQKAKNLEAVEDRNFLSQLKGFYRQRNEPLKSGHSLKELSLRCLYSKVLELGGYVAVCRHRRWRNISIECDYDPNRPAATRKIYERFLLQFENHERSVRAKLSNGKMDYMNKDVIDTIVVNESPLRDYEHMNISYNKSLRTPSPSPTKHAEKPEDLHITNRPAEELNREFLESLPRAEEKSPKIAVRPVEALRYPKENDVFKFREDPLSSSEKIESSYLSMPKSHQDFIANSALSNLSSLTQKYMSNLSNGIITPLGQEQNKVNRPTGVVTGMARSSLRSVRVKPTANRDPRGSLSTTPTIAPLRSDSASSSPPVITNFGINYPNQPQTQDQSDDEIVEVPYKPKTPEIIDLDEYPESPQSIKKKKLDILKERGLEVTAVPPAEPLFQPSIPLVNQPPVLLPMPSLMARAQLFQLYNIMPQPYVNGTNPPKIIQAKSIFGSSGPEKTVYGNPKDPFMPPPHILQGAPIKPTRNIVAPPQDVLDLTCKDTPKPAVEIVRVPNQPKPTTPRNYTLVDGKAVVGSNLEITLVSPKSSTPQKQKTQKRSSNGKFMSTKSTPEKPKDKAIIIPSYQVVTRDSSPASSNSSRDSFVPTQVKNMPLLDPLYMNALYSTLTGQLDQPHLAAYRDYMTEQIRNYNTTLLNSVGAITNTPTTKS